MSTKLFAYAGVSLLFSIVLVSALYVAGYTSSLLASELAQVKSITTETERRSVELGILELSPLGEAGGYAMPASGCSVVHQRCTVPLVEVCTGGGRGDPGTCFNSCPGATRPVVHDCTLEAAIATRVGGGSYSDNDRTINGGDVLQVDWAAGYRNENGRTGAWLDPNRNVVCTGTNFNTADGSAKSAPAFGRTNIDVTEPTSGSYTDYRVTCTYFNLTATDEVRVTTGVGPTAWIGSRANGGNWRGTDRTINPGDEVDIRWGSSNANGCNITQNGVGLSGALSNPGRGIIEPAPGSSHVIRIVCTGANGATASDQFTLTTNPYPAPTATLERSFDNGSSWSTADGSASTGQGTMLLRWTSANASSCVGSGSNGNNSFNTSNLTGGVDEVNLPDTPASRTFTVTCTGLNGTTASDSITITTFRPDLELKSRVACSTNNCGVNNRTASNSVAPNYNGFPYTYTGQRWYSVGDRTISSGQQIHLRWEADNVDFNRCITGTVTGPNVANNGPDFRASTNNFGFDRGLNTFAPGPEGIYINASSEYFNEDLDITEPTSGSVTYGVQCWENGNRAATEQTKTLTLTVAAAPTATLSASVNTGAFSTSNQTMNLGDTVRLSWTSTNAVSCTAIAGAGFDTGGRVSATDDSIDEPTVAGTFRDYTVRCTSADGRTADDTIRITAVASLAPDLDPNNPTKGGATTIGSQNHTFSTIVRNLGGAASGAHELYFEVDYFKDGSVNYTTPTQAQSSLNPNTDSALRTISATLNMPAGTHSFRARVPAIAAESNTTNNDSGWIDFTITPMVPTVTLTANNSTANPVWLLKNDEIDLEWTSTNAAACEAVEGVGFSTGGNPNNTHIIENSEIPDNNVSEVYRVRCRGLGTTDYSNASYVREASVTVRTRPECRDGVDNDDLDTRADHPSDPGCSSADDNDENDPTPTVNLTANPTRVNFGSATQLSWTSTSANACTASGAWSGNKAVSATNQTSGTISPFPFVDQVTFTLTCRNNDGGAASDDATVNVTPPGSITPDPFCPAANGLELVGDSVIRKGDSVELEWSVGVSSTCTLRGPGTGASGITRTGCNQSVVVNNIQNSGTYTLTCGGIEVPTPQPVRVLPTVQET